MTHLRVMLCFACSLPLFGCGTVFTRASPDLFGAYPLQAVVFDLAFISKVGEGSQEFMGMSPNGGWFFVTGVVSLPFDLAIDLVALPVDLVAWTLGATRTRGGWWPRMHSGDH